MFDKSDPEFIKLISKNKAAIYDLLFKKAADSLKSAREIALLYLGRPYYARRVLEEYNNIKKVNIFTTSEFKFIYEPYEKDSKLKIWYVEDPKDTFKDCDMKFDCIIMNPPYDRNLHLKILAEAITLLKDDDSMCVNLSPVRWLQDPLMLQKSKSDYHRFEKSILNHIKKIDVIDKIDAQRLFESTVMGADLGIYCCGSNGGFDGTSLVNPIVKKIVAKQNSHIKFEYDKRDGIRVRFPIICNNGGSGNGRKIELASFGKLLYFVDGKKDGKPWYDWYMKNQYSKNTDDIPFSARFNTEKEAQNFINTLIKTNFGRIYTHWMKRDVNVSPEIVLWMGDAVNPRTSLKGYQSEWTDADLYEYFNITSEEQKIIEETMEKYK